MPGSILDKLHATWPDLELSVCVLDRQKAPVAQHRRMDTRLLSSPLLKKLAYNVYFQGYDPKQAARSEWPKLTQALVTGGHVRSLRIEAKPDETRYKGDRVMDGTEPEKMMRLDITPGRRLAFLEELTIHVEGHWGGLPYPWDAEHRRLFREAIDASRLRMLDFGSDKPDPLFSALMGSLPRLKVLRFGIPRDGSVSVASRLIKSLKSLESLDIDQAQLGIDKLWPTIMKRKDTLKELILRPTTAGYCNPQYIDIDRLYTLSIQFPMLERLGWDAPCGTDVSLSTPSGHHEANKAG